LTRAPEARSLHLREFLTSDELEVTALWREVFPDTPPWNDPAEDIRRKLAVQRDLFLVATEADRVVGTVMAGFDGHRGWVYYLAVSPSIRQHGIGRALMDEAERRLLAYGCSKVNLMVRGTNPAVVPFYESLGYRVEDRIAMGKRIQT
jgi:ribosomal protein S18 acetylase RimI-like enzyme